MLGCAATPALFLLTVYKSESTIGQMHLPEQEHLRNVGQWVSWVTMALTIIFALIDRFLNVGFGLIDRGELPASGQDSTWMWRGLTKIQEDRLHGSKISQECVFWWCNALNEGWYEFAVWWKDPMYVAWYSCQAQEEDEDNMEDLSIGAVWAKIERPPQVRRATFSP